MRLVLALHAHLPWVRPKEPWTTEERWLHEALWESYLPLLAMVERLERDGVAAPLTLSLSPTLLAMWGDELLRRRFDDHLAAVEALAEAQASRGSTVMGHYRRRIAEARWMWSRHGAALGRAFGDLHRQGRIELMTTAATHALLPALGPIPDAIEAQMGLGQEVFVAATGVEPAGLWLPECAYDARVDAALARADVALTVVAEHAIRFARPGPGTLDGGAPTPVITPRGVLAVPRHREATLRIWSPTEGYPGHQDYREFHRDLGHQLDDADLGPFAAGTMTGLKARRIGGGVYDPSAGQARAAHHAEDMLEWLAGSGAPLVVMAFDAELFGHWWHEGIDFLEHLSRRATDAGVTVCALSDAVGSDPWPVVEPAPSTWGRGGDSHTWLGPRTARHWRLVHRLWRVAQRAWEGDPEAAAQASRAALLLQASDWTFMMDGTASADFARRQVAELAEATWAWAERARTGDHPIEPPEPGETRAPFSTDRLGRWIRPGG